MGCTFDFYSLFYHMESCGILEPSNELHLFALHYVFLPRINKKNDIRSFASDKGMRLNPKKCRELVINFLQYLPASPDLLHIDGSPVRRVDTCKILGVHLSSDLTWNVHIEYIVKKANKRLYALRTLKKAGVQPRDLVGIYRALIRSVLEYAAPVWSGLPVYLSEVLEAVQRRAMRIIYPYADYNTALCSAELGSLADRRDAICAKSKSQ